MMKHLYILLLSGYLLIGFAACKQHRPYDDQLAHIDSLADVNPNSADVLLLNSLAPLPTGEGQGIGLLLRIKIDDKLYRPITHYRDTILQLIDYFERHPRVLPRLLGSTGPALPYLYAGRIYSDLGDAPQALDYYQRALDVMPVGQIENGELKIENGEPSAETRRLAKQRGLLHSFIGTQLYYQGLYRDALCQYNDARRYDMYASDTIGVIYDLRDAAEQYKYLSLNDSSLLLYRNALQLSQQCNNGHLCRVVQSQIARLYIAKGDYELAHQYILPAINRIDTVDISSTYALASVIYKNIGDADSALYCYNKLLQYGNVTGKSLAFKELAAIATKKRDPSLALHYLSQYSLLIDSIRKMDNAETVARMHAAYNYQKHEREAHELKEKNDRLRHYLLLSSLAVVVMLLSAGIVVLRRRYRRQLVQSSMGKTDLLRYAYEQKTEQQKQQEREQVFGSPVYAAIQSHLRSTDDVMLNDDEWEQLHQMVNAVYPNFRSKLTSLTAMNAHEYHVCLLLKIGVKPSSIAKLTAHSAEAISSSRRRLYERAMKKSGKSRDWDELVTIL
jgi:tetratricopeptide (TPR) repeat protein